MIVLNFTKLYTYKRIDHAIKACVTALLNLVTEPQKMQNKVISEKKRVKFGVLFCEETVSVPVDFFIKILKRRHDKDLQLV